jgi:hypothetical protein
MNPDTLTKGCPQFLLFSHKLAGLDIVAKGQANRINQGISQENNES